MSSAHGDAAWVMKTTQHLCPLVHRWRHVTACERAYARATTQASADLGQETLIGKSCMPHKQAASLGTSEGAGRLHAPSACWHTVQT